MLIDQHLRTLSITGIALFAVATVLFGTRSSPAAIYIGALVWRLGFGSAATLFQTALARAAGSAADVAQAMIVTVWNFTIPGGAILDGTLLERVRASSLPWLALVRLTATG
ncbi:MFS transporter [Sphingobium yanoikuyae]|uniref:MFS transporter n=1 Tax=Sphingobium yanoikuyae TaxID=13690 RepID=A0A291MYC6_SPHYA|nr:MFS transporter [Sphingobium yanoikuyae]ATI79900.1 hypothetical protein A6768_07620 [Sphingobium yanoikuyae]